MKSDITLSVATAENELIIREGKALDPKEPVAVRISGNLDSPLRWLEKRAVHFPHDEAQDSPPVWLEKRAVGFSHDEAHIIVDREKLTIKLKINETDYYGATISGSLELHPLFSLFAVNTGKYLTNFEMAQLFKMNRTVFENQTVAMGLVSELQNFRAKVEREVEKLNDNRGNKRDLLAQTVQSNLPDTFILVMPIFKGTARQTFPVEVYIKPDDFSCTLISPVANDLIEEMRDTEIDTVLTGIREIAPDIVIIEQ